MTLPLILASASPRRCEILNTFSIPFEVVSHSFDERCIPWNNSEHTYAQELALAKAQNVAAHYPTRTVIAADTIVYIDGQLLNKPKTRAEAASMLRQLSGKWHKVITGISVISSGSVQTRSDETRVFITPLTDHQIDSYLQLNIWSDKAGGYAIQGSGAIFVQRIEGCYYNVIGLPVVPLSTMLSTIGIDLWTYLK